MPHCLLTCHMQAEQCTGSAAAVLSLLRQPGSPGRCLAFLCRERGSSGRTQLPPRHLVSQCQPSHQQLSCWAMQEGLLQERRCSQRWWTGAVAPHLWADGFGTAASKELQDEDDSCSSIYQPGRHPQKPRTGEAQDSAQQPGPYLCPWHPLPYQVPKGVHADVHLHRQRGHLSPPGSPGHGQRQALSHRGSILHIPCFGGAVVLCYESLWVISQVAQGLCCSQFIGAMPFPLMLDWENAAGIQGSGCSQIKILFPRAYEHLPWICMARAWWTADNALGRAGSGHPLESIWAYLEADIVSNTKSWVENAICRSWEQILIVEVPVLFTLDCLIMCRWFMPFFNYKLYLHLLHGLFILLKCSNVTIG